MFLGPLAPSCSVIIAATYAALQLMHPLAEGIPVPAQFPLGLALPAFTQHLDHPRHENPPLMPFERPCRCPVQFLLRFTQFDGSILHSIALVYPCRAFFLQLPKRTTVGINIIFNFVLR